MILTQRSDFNTLCDIDDLSGQHIASYKNWQLSSAFQPIFDQNKSIIGFEALLRAQCLKTHATIAPCALFNSDDVPDSDKINIDRLSQAVHIRNFAQSSHSHLRLFLNILPISSEYRASTQETNGLLLHRLGELAMCSQQVVMEIVESESVNDQLLCSAVNELKANGFGVAIDDFGSLASTVERIKLLAPNIIKIDRCLLCEYMQGNQAPLSNIITMAKRIGAPTVIEGIEDHTQFAAMQALNFDFYQGFYLARPAPLH